MGEFLKVHAVSIAVHAGLLALLGLIVPTARDVLAKSRPVEIELLAPVPSASAPPTLPPAPLPVLPSRMPATPRRARVPDRAKVAIVDKPRPFQEAADPSTGRREAPSDVLEIPSATTPLPSLEMESTSLAGAATEYMTTSSTTGTLGVRRGAGGRGGTGAGRGAPGTLGGQEGADLEVSPDWEVTEQPVALNDRDFDPVYPTLARQEGREGDVVVRLFIDAEGRVEDARVIEAAGHGFDESALEYARKLRFRPARTATHAVAFRIDWTVEFHVRD
jgi:protein TonB